jgi:hypothetical protein
VADGPALRPGRSAPPMIRLTWRLSLSRVSSTVDIRGNEQNEEPYHAGKRHRDGLVVSLRQRKTLVKSKVLDHKSTMVLIKPWFKIQSLHYVFPKTFCLKCRGMSKYHGIVLGLQKYHVSVSEFGCPVAHVMFRSMIRNYNFFYIKSIQ